MSQSGKEWGGKGVKLGAGTLISEQLEQPFGTTIVQTLGSCWQAAFQTDCPRVPNASWCATVVPKMITDRHSFCVCNLFQLQIQNRAPRRINSNFRDRSVEMLAEIPHYRCRFSEKKKQHKHKLFGPDFPRTFLTLTSGRPWIKKFLPITGAAEKRTFWCGRPRFSARTSTTRRVLEKLCAKRVCIVFLAPRFSLKFSINFHYRYRLRVRNEFIL